jgi:hypothetical protein
MVVRDHTGSALFASTKCEDILVSPLVAEAMGLRWSLIWAEVHCCKNLIIETDAETVVMSLYGDVRPVIIDNLIMDCLEI